MSAFNRLKHKIEKKEGISDKRAAAITAAIGRKKLGEKEMARRSAEGRKHKESRMESEPCKMSKRADGSYEVPDTWKGDCSATGDVGRRWGPDANKGAGKLPHTFKGSSGE